MRMVMGGALAAILVLGTPAWADDLMKKAQENFKPIPSVVPAMKDNAVRGEGSLAFIGRIYGLKIKKARKSL